MCYSESFRSRNRDETGLQDRMWYVVTSGVEWQDSCLGCCRAAAGPARHPSALLVTSP